MAPLKLAKKSALDLVESNTAERFVYGSIGGEIWAHKPTGLVSVDQPMLDELIADLPAGSTGRLHNGGDTPYARSTAWVINKECSIRGAGARGVFARVVPIGTTQAVDQPVSAPWLRGSVILQTGAGQDGIYCPAGGYAVNLRGIGVRYDDAIKLVDTGHAFHALPTAVDRTGLDHGLLHSIWEDLAAYGVDGNHYTMRWVNPLLCGYDMIRGWHGGVIQIEALSDPAGYNYGNIEAGDSYGQLTAGGTADGYSLKENRPLALNLINFKGRTQCNAGNTSKYPQAKKVAARQTVDTLGVPTGGTFTLTYSGQVTAAIAYNASAATIQAELEALSTIGASNVVCLGGPLPALVNIEFLGIRASNSVILTATNALTGGKLPAARVRTAQYLFNNSAGVHINFPGQKDFESSYPMPVDYGLNRRSFVAPGGIHGSPTDLTSANYRVAGAADLIAVELGSDLVKRGRANIPTIVSGSANGTTGVATIGGNSDDYSGIISLTPGGTGITNVYNNQVAVFTPAIPANVRAPLLRPANAAAALAGDIFAIVSGNTFLLRFQGNGTGVFTGLCQYSYQAAPI